MRHKFSILIYWCLFICCLSSDTTGNHTFVAADEFISTTEQLRQIASEFRGLRAIRGQFDGGTWDNDVDRWMGPKHRLMLELGARLGCGEFPKTDIIQLLNPPDHIARKGDRLYDQIFGLPGYDDWHPAAYEFLIYFWRGRHDFLFFACQGGVILGSDWWYGGD
jgi:hypothetical protein